MSNDYGNKGLTNKHPRSMKQPKSSHLAVPVVVKADVEKKASVINDATKSGKQNGAFLISNKELELRVQVAVGSKPEDKWSTLKQASEITPA